MLRKVGQVDQNKLIGEQKNLFQDLIDFVENDDRQMFCIEAEGGSGKAIDVDTMIPTPYNGFMRFGDLKKGDYVFGDDGNPTKVVEIYPQGVIPSYKVLFRDKTSVRCCEDHLWGVFTPYTRSSGKKPKTMSTKDIIEKGFRDNSGSLRYSISPTPVLNYDFTPDILIEPYVLGALLGDGTNLNKSPVLCSVDPFVPEKIGGILGEDYEMKGFRFDGNPCGYYRCMYIKNHTNPLARKFKSYKLGVTSPERFIPDDYFYTSFEDRLELVRGLMDTDGCVSRNRTSLSTVSRRLALDFVRLVRSLGGVAVLNERKRTRHYGDFVEYIEYNINVRLDSHCPFSLPRKVDGWKKPKYPYHKSIMDITPDGNCEQMCITVDNESKLFLINDGVVTHNTYTTSMFAEYMLYNSSSFVGMGALTHKAVFVQTKQAEYYSDNLEYRTIQSILGVKPQINEHGREVFYRTMKDADKSAVGDYDIMFIDEVSQKDSILMGYLEEDLQKFPNVKVIFMGDLFQLGPAGEGSCSIPLNPLMREKKNIRYFRLTQVIRQKDSNPVLKHCRLVRDDIIKVAKDNSDRAKPALERTKERYEENPKNKNFENAYFEARGVYLNSVIYTLGRDIPTGDFYKPYTDVNSNGEGVILVRKKDQNKVLKTLFGEKFEKNPDFVRMTSWTNKEVNRHSSLIRKMMYRKNIMKFIADNKSDPDLKTFIKEKFPYYNIVSNDLKLPKYLAGDQIIVDKPIFNESGEIIFNTSEELNIVDIINNTVMAMNERYESYQAVVENIWTGKKNVIEICHENSEKLLEKELERLADLAKKEKMGSNSRRTRWVDYYTLRKRFAQLKYLPSMTTYKAQGSTYENIIVNYSDIMRNPKKIQRLQHLYVAMSRASKCVYIFE